MIEAEEEALVEQLVTHSPVEALGIAVLHGLSRRDVMPQDLVILRPGKDGIRGSLRDTSFLPDFSADDTRELTLQSLAP